MPDRKAGVWTRRLGGAPHIIKGYVAWVHDDESPSGKRACGHVHRKLDAAKNCAQRMEHAS